MIRRELRGSPGELSEFNLPTLEQATAKNYGSREHTKEPRWFHTKPSPSPPSGLAAYQEGEAEEATPTLATPSVWKALVGRCRKAGYPDFSRPCEWRFEANGVYAVLS